jgi:leucyl/phenylalanyl-tRNA--protein transferase
MRYQAALRPDIQYSNPMLLPPWPDATTFSLQEPFDSTMPPHSHPHLHWMEPGDALPGVRHAWGTDTDAPGLLAAGGDLSVNALVAAYAQGVFPWFSEGQPILWWSTEPRMALKVSEFRLHRSLKKTIQSLNTAARCEIRMDHDFRNVIEACARSPRKGQDGTWIVAPMVEAYVQLHAAGHAHSVETWIDGILVGGLYCVVLGRAVFGESMFARHPDASKIALAALVAFCREMSITLIDCQQNTSHLASLGASEISRDDFLQHVASARTQTPVQWQFDPLYWKHLLLQRKSILD